MFLKLFDILPGWAWASIVVLCVTAGCAEREGKLHAQVLTAKAQKETSDVRKEVAEREGERNRLALELTSAKAELSQLRAQRQVEINNVIQQEKRATAVARADGAGTRKLLIEATTVAAGSPGGQGGGDSPALRRAETVTAAYGELLGQCDAVAEDLGGKAEDLASQVRALIAAYDSLLVKSAALDPLPDGDQVHPGVGIRWNNVMNATLPDLAVDPSVDGGLGFRRVHAKIIPQWNPAAH